MSTELFNLPVCKSPRLLWIEKHGLKTHFSPHIEEEPWACWSGDLQTAIERDAVALGVTEDEAITNWAKNNGLRLWNEEPL